MTTTAAAQPIAPRADAAASGNNGARDRKQPPVSAAGLWSSFQTSAFIVLAAGATFVSLLIMTAGLPMIITHRAGAPLWPDVQAFNTAVLVVHVVTAVPPLLIGFFSFSTAARRMSLKWHRWTGTAYCVCIWISAVTGLALATANTQGVLAQAGFSCLAIAWFTTTTMAYRTARAKQLIAHRQWMIRSFSLTLAVLAVRPIVHFAPGTGLPIEIWYPAMTWLCWVPNL
ncbi:MAG: DUF2306 domain-containing protein, partial [Pseudomonadota bacterium]